jgi:hypothetical protein
VRVYYFVNEQFGLQNLVYRELKISRIDDVNDPFEWAAPSSADTEHRVAFKKMKSTMAKGRGFICFSTNWQNPLLWSHYADRHRGWCLGFDVPDEDLAKVRYLKNRIECDWPKFLENSGYREQIVNQIIITKFDHWSYEAEVRSFVSLDESTQRNGLYFLDFSEKLQLKEIIVGALSTVTRTQLKNALGNLASDVRCGKARLAFRSFKVVKQFKADLWK